MGLDYAQVVRTGNLRRHLGMRESGGPFVTFVGSTIGITRTFLKTIISVDDYTKLRRMVAVLWFFIIWNAFNYVMSLVMVATGRWLFIVGALASIFVGKYGYNTARDTYRIFKELKPEPRPQWWDELNA